MSAGSLTVVGTGIHLVGDLTLAAKAWIEQADKVLFAVADPVTAEWLRTLNATAEALPYHNTLYQRRRDIYRALVERIMLEVRRQLNVCVVFYGHPGVFVDPAHEAICQARHEGFKAQMLPGISALDWLFADIGFDPAQSGCQTFEATDFLIRRRKFDPTSALILWQIGVIGNSRLFDASKVAQGTAILAEVLTPWYGVAHEIVVYEAAVYPVCQPVVQRLPLGKLPLAQITEVSTLYVPANALAPVDLEMMTRLGMTRPGAKAKDDMGQ